ncbi:hypothetical protein PB01_10005 [Psychrobacillus glaciei]|uniref:Uncharacterized protein n=1 Tax=Psychrobacillus glaciei TaxID=2283160 RepID=A0A5J6SMJ7_9BACI|nr:hypothetical protein [Psychrobacillus glaciei]QFF99136.1 hypothetical protein PB01_10005 [Psychrobacillus glaciei]
MQDEKDPNWLKALADRPDLEPDKDFVESLRNKIHTPIHSSWKSAFVPMVIIMPLTIVVALVLFFIVRQDFKTESVFVNSAGACVDKPTSFIRGSQEIIGDEEYKFVRVSASHKNKVGEKHPMTLWEMDDLQFDEENRSYVQYFGGYEIGDKIAILDKVMQVKYDATTNLTTIRFENDTKSYFLLHFKGDARSKVKQGEDITLYFKVVPYLDCFDYETLDYFKLLLKNEYLEIEAYLKK